MRTNTLMHSSRVANNKSRYIGSYICLYRTNLVQWYEIILTHTVKLQELLEINTRKNAKVEIFNTVGICSIHRIVLTELHRKILKLSYYLSIFKRRKIKAAG